MQAILKASNGDMRKAVTFLQSAYQLSTGESEISAAVVTDLSGLVSFFIKLLCIRSFLKVLLVYYFNILGT